MRLMSCGEVLSRRLMMKRILFGILNAKRVHSIEEERERDLGSGKERACAREERRIVFGNPSREEEKTQETLASGG